MFTAGMKRVLEERLRIFTRLGYRQLKKIADMESADVPEALDCDMLSLDGTIVQQKQRLFDPLLQKRKSRVHESYTPEDSVDKEKFSAAVDYEIGNLIANWESCADPQDALSNIAGEGAGIERGAGPRSYNFPT